MRFFQEESAGVKIGPYAVMGLTVLLVAAVMLLLFSAKFDILGLGLG